MAVDVDRAFADVMPGAEWVMAQDQEPAVDLALGIIGNARPTLVLDRCGPVIVADDEMLAAVEGGERFGDSPGLRDRSAIAQMIDFVLLPDDLVPAGDQRGVMLGNGREGALIDPNPARIAEMRVLVK
jgi:hypothetical protein